MAVGYLSNALTTSQPSGSTTAMNVWIVGSGATGSVGFVTVTGSVSIASGGGLAGLDSTGSVRVPTVQSPFNVLSASAPILLVGGGGSDSLVHVLALGSSGSVGEFAVDWSNQTIINTATGIASATLNAGWYLMGVSGVPAYIISAAGGFPGPSIVTNTTFLVPVGMEDKPKWCGQQSGSKVTYSAQTVAGTGQVAFIAAYRY